MLLAGCHMAPQRKWRKSLWNQKKKRGCSGGRLMLRATTRGQRRGKKRKNKTLGSCVSFRESTHTLLLLLQSLWFSAVNSSFRFFFFVVSLFFGVFFLKLSDSGRRTARLKRHFLFCLLLATTARPRTRMSRRV